MSCTQMKTRGYTKISGSFAFAAHTACAIMIGGESPDQRVTCPSLHPGAGGTGGTEVETYESAVQLQLHRDRSEAVRLREKVRSMPL